VGESFFWYRPTRVVPDQRLLNGCVCVCSTLCYVIAVNNILSTVNRCSVIFAEFGGLRILCQRFLQTNTDVSISVHLILFNILCLVFPLFAYFFLFAVIYFTVLLTLCMQVLFNFFFSKLHQVVSVNNQYIQLW